MCGRFIQSSRADDYAGVFAADLVTDPERVPPRFNVAPSQPVLIARERSRGRRELAWVRWGLIPSWSKGPDSRFSMINARVETIHQKPAYRGPLRYRRCLIPTEGFYEWKAAGRLKQPYCIRQTDGGIFALAGLWDLWLGPGGEEIESCTIIVTAANATVAPVHERMPVILPRQRWAEWLDPAQQQSAAAVALLEPFDPPVLTAYPVSRRVNSPSNDGPELAAPSATSLPCPGRSR
jgi:putative SOS response-associated peptidase YedK